MPKMGLEATIEEVEKGFNWPATQFARAAVATVDLPKYKLRKRTDDQYHIIWGMGVGEMGKEVTWYFGHRMLDAAKKALEAKGGGGNGA